MSAECQRCGWDLPYDGDCVVCDENGTFCSQLSEARKLLERAATIPWKSWVEDVRAYLDEPANAEAQNALTLEEAKTHWKRCEEGWNRVILQAETFQRERDDALIAHSEVRGQLGVEVAKRVEAIDRWDTSSREMEGLAKQVLAERNEAREERDDAQQTIDAMRAEGCPARGLVENIFNGLTSHGQPTSPLLAKMAEAAAKLLVDVPVCEHKDELKRLRELVYNYLELPDEEVQADGE